MKRTVLKELVVDTPAGRLHAALGAQGILAMDFAEHWAANLTRLRRRLGPLRLVRVPAPVRVARALRAYFAGHLDALDALPVDAGGTPFQRRAWRAMRRIPAGRTVSYGALARTLGTPRGARAVGLAAARNPVAVIVPCHRVVGARGALTGYAGGLARKRWLLRHEGAAAGSATA